MAQSVNTDSARPGAERIEGTLSATASSVEVHVNSKPARIQKVSLENGSFTVRLAVALMEGDIVSVREIENGRVGPWTPAIRISSTSLAHPALAGREALQVNDGADVAWKSYERESSSASAATRPSNPQATTPTDKNTAKDPASGISGGPMLRTIVGFEQAGVSAAQSQQDFFLDLLYDRPIAFASADALGPKLRLWGNLRVSSVPQQISTDVATFATTFPQQVGQLKVNEVAQAFEFLGGTDYRFWEYPNDSTYKSTDQQNDPDTQTKISSSFILGGGVITPISPKDSAQIFEVPSNQPAFFTQFPQAVGKQFVVFTLPDRNRFFRQAYGGLRMKTNFIGSSNRYPETFDLTYGFNESVTGGKIRGGVMRLEGFVPIPYAKASWIYLFGTGLFKPGGRATISNPFLLAAAPSGTLPTDPNAVVITTPQPDRDYYRVGIGIDFVNLVANWKNITGNKSQSSDANNSKANQNGKN